MLAGDHSPPATSSSYHHGEPSTSILASPSSPPTTKGKARAGSLRYSFSIGPLGVSPPLHPYATSQAQQQQATSHARHRSASITSGTRQSFSSEAALAKEKEFMANTRILAMSNVIDSFTSSSHAKQGFYGKQLKVIGTCPSSPSTMGAELDLIIKIHVIDNTWTTCPLLPSSTILHRWKATHLDGSNHTDGENVQDDLAASQAYLKDEKDAAWVQATVEKDSPAASPTYEHHHHHHKRRPLSTSSVSSYSVHITPKTHVAVISNALCFVTNRAGDYLVQLSIHAPFIPGTGSRSIHLSYIPRCRSNFIKFQVDPPDNNDEGGLKQDSDGPLDAASETQEEGTATGRKDGFEFNIHPKVVSLDEAHLNPESDEDAQFWLEVQELLVGRDQFVGKLVGENEMNGTSDGTQEGSVTDTNADTKADPFMMAGCFAPSSTLHISWLPRNATGFVKDVQQDTTIQIMGLPDQTKSSTLVQNRRRKNPEDSHAIDQADQDDDPMEYEHLEMDDGDLVLSVEDAVTLNIQKLGWKQPFVDFTIELPATQQGQSNDVSLVDIRGDTVQNWETIDPVNVVSATSSELEALEKDSAADQETYTPSVYRVWFLAGTEGMTEVHISVHVGQAVSVGYGKDITCHIPKLRIHGTSMDRGRIHICTSNDLVIQRSHPRLLESLPVDGHSLLEDGMAARHHPVLQYQYQSPAYELAVVVQRYQALGRIARIERVRAEIGVSNHQQPGFARIVLSNIVLPHQDDSYLRVYQLDGAEVWSVLVNGKPCSKSIQFMDRRTAGQRTILIPIPEDSPDNDNPHQVEISYGFNTFERTHEDGLNDESLMSTIKLVVPGFNLPVGEYVVVASLPKLEQGVDYDEPTEDFEIMSSQGLPGQRRTITYGAYMTLGRPKLSIRTSKVAESRTRITHVVETVAVERAEQNTTEPLEQIARSNVHATAVVHDPQQPPPNVAVAPVHQASQRHPQQPLELQNTHAEHTLDGEILPVLSTRANGTMGGGAGVAQGYTSNLSPQVGSPASFRSAGQMSFNLLGSLRSMSFVQVQHMVRLWWKQVVAPIAAIALVIMIINVAAFQETQTTSLDLVRMPVWRRPFAAFGRLWQDSSMRYHSTTDYTSELEATLQDTVASETASAGQGRPEETRWPGEMERGPSSAAQPRFETGHSDIPITHREGHFEAGEESYHGQEDAPSEQGTLAAIVDYLSRLFGRDQKP